MNEIKAEQTRQYIDALATFEALEEAERDARGTARLANSEFARPIPGAHQPNGGGAQPWTAQSRRPSRRSTVAYKARRDRLQAEVVQTLMHQYLPHLTAPGESNSTG